MNFAGRLSVTFVLLFNFGLSESENFLGQSDLESIRVSTSFPAFSQERTIFCVGINKKPRVPK